MNNFRKLIMWKKSISLVKDVYLLVKEFPREEKYNLVSQMTRCTVSIPSNIAEGCSRTSTKEFKHYLEISMGSAFELETYLTIIEDIGIITKNRVSLLNDKLLGIQKMLNSYITKLKKSNL